MSMTINPRVPDQIFIGLYGYGTQGKLCFESTNGGERWRDFSTGLPDSGAVNCIEIDTANNKMYAGVGGYLRGLYTTDIITELKPPVAIAPKDFQLLQNYPNPFNPTTVINYRLPTSGFTRLTVYDILGREIKSLVEGYEQAGTHAVVFYAQNLASGVYFYRLSANRESLTRKMVIVR